MDSTSKLVYKDGRLAASDIFYKAQLRDVQKGYWNVYLTKDNGFQISQADSIPLKKGKLHIYAGSYAMNRDTLNLTFNRNHILPNLEYITFNTDTLSIKLSTFKEALALKGWYVKW